MATIDLSDYSLAELKGLLFDIDKEIQARQRQAREQILSIADGAGIPVDKLLGGGEAG